MDTIVERIRAIQSELAAAAEAWGRAPELIAVTKTVDTERINALASAGIFHIGENHAQEILEKLPHLDARFEIDFIGQLQNNKVKHIIDKVAMIQSLDRTSLAEEIDRRAVQRGIRMPVLIEVNIAGEPQKGGIPADEVLTFAAECARREGLLVSGLMCVMPNTDREDVLMPLFRQMRTLFEQLRDEAISGTKITTLSMGMSGDYLLAARAGATHVRIGSAIFGKRVYSQKS